MSGALLPVAPLGAPPGAEPKAWVAFCGEAEFGGCACCVRASATAS